VELGVFDSKEKLCVLDTKSKYVCILITFYIHSFIQYNTIYQTNISACLLFIFYVDGTRIRVFKNKDEELGGVDVSYNYPNNQALRI